MVVVGQPGPTPVMVPMAPRAPDYMGFSICTLVLCLICGGLPFLLCAIVALVFSLKVRRGEGSVSISVWQFLLRSCIVLRTTHYPIQRLLGYNLYGLPHVPSI